VIYNSYWLHEFNFVISAHPQVTAPELHKDLSSLFDFGYFLRNTLHGIGVFDKAVVSRAAQYGTEWSFDSK
jgi:hypothetical protein